MIKTTNKMKKFFENDMGKIIIYGAGRYGYWIGKYMNDCNIPFECYVDKKTGGGYCTMINPFIQLKN